MPAPLRIAIFGGAGEIGGNRILLSWDNAGNNGGNIDKFVPSTVRGGHAVCIVGYRADGRFIVRNSWGTTWGDKGFGYASLAYAQNAFTEAYGISV